MNTVMTLITIAVYLVGMILIGVKYGKDNNTTGEFYLGGRKLGPLVTAMSAEASDMSSWLLMGLPGLALAGGFAEATWTAIGLAIGTYINWLIVAKRLRRYTAETKSDTVPDFFSNRFADKSGALLAISAIIIVIFFVPYTASGFSAIGKLFNSLFGVNYHIAMIVGAAVIVLYTVLGGFMAVSTTDFLQSIVMTIALFVIICFGMNQAGSLDTVIKNINDYQGYFSLTANGAYGALPIASTLAWGLGYFGMPHILLRFMAIEDENKLKTSRRVATVWVVISMAMAIFIGIVGYTFVWQEGTILQDGFDAERIIVYMANAIKEVGPLAAIVAGLILAGILAATMSTADSQLIAASSGVTQDICKNFFKINLSNKALMWVARISVIAISVIAVFLARDPDSSVFRIVSFAWAGFGAAFGPVVLAALFWKRANKWGALAGMISGAAMVFIWKYLIAPIGGVFAIYELLPAFIVGCIFLVVVSLITGKPSDDVVNGYEEAKAACKE